MRELDKVLDKNEKVSWEGKPEFWPFFVGRSLILTIFGGFWMGIMIIFAFVSFSAMEGASRFIIFITPHFWIGIAMLFGPVIYNSLVYKHTYYAITGKRILIQKGLIGRDFDMVDFDQITNATVNVGVMDKIFGKDSGSILISTAGAFVATKNGVVSAPYVFSNVEKPYDVFKFLKKISYDVKTDIEYPNQLRPNENPGYQTSYNPNEGKSKK